MLFFFFPDAVILSMARSLELLKEPFLNFLTKRVHGKEPEKQNCILILGNEGQGLSLKARQLQKVAIPMPGNMESLNVSAAGAILMYVIGRP